MNAFAEAREGNGNGAAEETARLCRGDVCNRD